MVWQGGFDLGLNCFVLKFLAKPAPTNELLNFCFLHSVRAAFPLGNTPELLNF
jgi:hypothetical protein